MLLSLPGPAVLGEAMDAIDAGRHLMIFSDNVPVADEIAIKDAAAAARAAGDGPGLRHRDHRRESASGSRTCCAATIPVRGSAWSPRPGPARSS